MPLFELFNIMGHCHEIRPLYILVRTKHPSVFTERTKMLAEWYVDVERHPSVVLKWK